MRPVRFPQVNKTFIAPEGWNEEKHGPCDNLHVFDEGTCLISKWELSKEERQEIANGASIWLFVTGNNHPPVGFLVNKDIFNALDSSE